MFSRVRIAIRFFFVGLAVGVLLAPRSGVETRRLLRQRADRALSDLLDAATMSVPGKADTSTRTDGGGQTDDAGRTDGDAQAPASSLSAGDGDGQSSPDGGSGWQEPAMSSEEA
jgi:hypothetical protein